MWGVGAEGMYESNNVGIFDNHTTHSMWQKDQSKLNEEKRRNVSINTILP
jgi:hypothetical protein